MKNLLLNIPQLREDLRNRPLAVFLDYDGTLADIAPTPAEARLRPETKADLEILKGLKNVRTAVISGRGLKDIRAMVGVRGITYVGSHGAEFSGAKGFFSRTSPKYRRALQTVRERLMSGAEGYEGVLFEEKPLSLAVHFRRSPDAVEERIKQLILEVCTDYVYRGEISILNGKKVVEILPPEKAEKKSAVKKLLRAWKRKNLFPIYIGDDVTDESAFKEIRDTGLTVKVCGEPVESAARYFLKTPQDVRSFLEVIIYLRTQ